MSNRISIVTLGVSDMGISISFYRDGLGFPTIADDGDGWAIFRTCGSRLALYPRERLADDIGSSAPGAGFGGITLAQNLNSRAEVDEMIGNALRAGGVLLKKPQQAEWGGYSGYFADPDGYPWEVAWGEEWQFDEQGLLWGGPLGSPPPRRRDP